MVKLTFLKDYEITHVVSYLAIRDILRYTETEHIHALTTKNDKVQYLESLLDRDTSRCSSFAKALHSYSANVYAESSRACHTISKCSADKHPRKPKKASTSSTDAVAKKQVAMETETDETIEKSDERTSVVRSQQRSSSPASISMEDSNEHSTLVPSDDLTLRDSSPDLSFDRSPERQSQDSHFEFHTPNEFTLSQESPQDKEEFILPETEPDSDYKTMTSLPSTRCPSTVPNSSSQLTHDEDPVRSRIHSYYGDKRPRRRSLRDRLPDQLTQVSNWHGNPADQRHGVNGHVYNVINHYHFGGDPSSNIPSLPYSFGVPSLTQMGPVAPPGYESGTRSRSNSDEEQSYYEMKRDLMKRGILEKYSSQLMQSLNVPCLLPHLQREHLVTPWEFEQLQNEHSTYKRNSYLLTIIPTKGKDGFERFLKCLKSEKEHSGHVDLAKLLEARFNKLMPSHDV